MKTAQDYYESGIDLFNAGQFFECHEAWEEVWKRSEGDQKRFYQGLIQAAVAILHAERGNLGGARTVYRRACEKLDSMPSELHGIALGELRDNLREFFDVVLSSEGPKSAGKPQLPRVRRLEGANCR